jgi:hypothetical protein
MIGGRLVEIGLEEARRDGGIGCHVRGSSLYAALRK